MAAFLEGLKFAENALNGYEFPDAQGTVTTKQEKTFAEGMAAFWKHKGYLESDPCLVRNERREAIIKLEPLQ